MRHDRTQHWTKSDDWSGEWVDSKPKHSDWPLHQQINKMSVIGYIAPSAKMRVKSFDAFQSRRADTLDCLPNLFRYAIITKKTDPRPGVMGSFSN